MTYLDGLDHEDTIPFKLVIGGKQPPVRGGNWLSKLKSWTVFCAQNLKLSKEELFVFQVREKYANTTVLICHTTPEPQVRYFSTKDFSEVYTLMDILDEPEPGNRTDLDRRLEVDVIAEEVDPLVKDTGSKDVFQDVRNGDESI